MNTSFLFLADGFEEIEALSVIDIMRRAGMKVTTVSVSESATVTGAHGIQVVADTLLPDTDCSVADWLILPGGMPGAVNLAGCSKLCELLKSQHANGGKVAAICASPAVVLAPLGILNGKEATCYPGFEKELKNSTISENSVAVDGNVITANGPATATLFALAIVANSLGEEVSRSVAEGMLLYNAPQEFYF